MNFKRRGRSPSKDTKTITWQLIEEEQKDEESGLRHSSQDDDAGSSKKGILKKASNRSHFQNRVGSLPSGKYTTPSGKGLSKRSQRVSQTKQGEKGKTALEKTTSLVKGKRKVNIDITKAGHQEEDTLVHLGQKQEHPHVQSSPMAAKLKGTKRGLNLDMADNSTAKQKPPLSKRKKGLNSITSNPISEDRDDKAKKQTLMMQTKKFESNEKQPQLPNITNIYNNVNSLNNVHYESEGEVDSKIIYSKQAEEILRSKGHQSGEHILQSSGKGFGKGDNQKARNLEINTLSYENQANRLTQITPREQNNQGQITLNSMEGGRSVQKGTLPSVHEQYESPWLAGQISSPSQRDLETQNSVVDQAGFVIPSVFVGRDIFLKFESLNFQSVLDARINGPRQRNLLNQQFHGRQVICRTKQELIQAKRESRALRTAKLQQVKFEDAFVSKAVEITQKKLVHSLLKEVFQKLEPPLSPKKASSRKASHQPRLETPDQFFKDPQYRQSQSPSKNVDVFQVDDQVTDIRKPSKLDSETRNKSVEAGSSVKDSQAQHEILSGNSLNIFNNVEKTSTQEAIIPDSPRSLVEHELPQDSKDREDLRKPKNLQVRQMKKGSKKKMKNFSLKNQNQLIQQSLNSRQKYDPKMFQLDLIKAAAVSACQAAHTSQTGNQIYKDKDKQQTLKYYLPQNKGYTGSVPPPKNKTIKVSNKIKVANEYGQSMNRSGQNHSQYGYFSSNVNSRRSRRDFANHGESYAQHSIIDINDISSHIKLQVEYQQLIKNQGSLDNPDLQGQTGYEFHSIQHDNFSDKMSFPGTVNNIHIEAMDASSTEQTPNLQRGPCFKKQNTEKLEGRRQHLKNQSSSPPDHRGCMVRQSHQTDTIKNPNMDMQRVNESRKKAQSSHKALRPNKAMNNFLNSVPFRSGTRRVRDLSDQKILFSASKQKFQIQGPILRLNNYQKTNERINPRAIMKHYHQKFVPTASDGSEAFYPNQYTDKTSEDKFSRDRISKQKQDEILLSFDFNERDDINQQSILAMSHGNFYQNNSSVGVEEYLSTQSQHRQIAPQYSQIQHSERHDIRPQYLHQGVKKIRKNTSSQKKRGSNTGNSHLSKRSPIQTITPVEQNECNEEVKQDEATYYDSNVPDKSDLKVKRANTLDAKKKSQQQQVIEEGSENSFASGQFNQDSLKKKRGSQANNFTGQRLLMTRQPNEARPSDGFINSRGLRMNKRTLGQQQMETSPPQLNNQLNDHSEYAGNHATNISNPNLKSYAGCHSANQGRARGFVANNELSQKQPRRNIGISGYQRPNLYTRDKQLQYPNQESYQQTNQQPNDKIWRMYSGINMPNMKKFKPMARDLKTVNQLDCLSLKSNKTDQNLGHKQNAQFLARHDKNNSENEQILSGQEMNSLVAISPQHQSMGKFPVKGSPMKPSNMTSSLTHYKVEEQAKESVTQQSQEGQIQNYNNFSKYYKTNYISDFNNLQNNMFLGAANSQSSTSNNLAGINRLKLQKIARPYIMSAHNTASKQPMKTQTQKANLTHSMAGPMGSIQKSHGKKFVGYQNTMRYIPKPAYEVNTKQREANTIQVHQGLTNSDGKSVTADSKNQVLYRHNFGISPKGSSQGITSINSHAGKYAQKPGAKNYPCQSNMSMDYTKDQVSKEDESFQPLGNSSTSAIGREFPVDEEAKFVDQRSFSKVRPKSNNIYSQYQRGDNNFAHTYGTRQRAHPKKQETMGQLPRHIAPQNLSGGFQSASFLAASVHAAKSLKRSGIGGGETSTNNIDNQSQTRHQYSKVQGARQKINQRHARQAENQFINSPTDGRKPTIFSQESVVQGETPHSMEQMGDLKVLAMNNTPF